MFIVKFCFPGNTYFRVRIFIDFFVTFSNINNKGWYLLQILYHVPLKDSFIIKQNCVSQVSHYFGMPRFGIETDQPQVKELPIMPCIF